MAAHLLVYALPLRDINDNVVVGGTIEFFEPGGSSTPKSVWSNYTLTTGAGTTVDTDAYGMPEKSSTSIEVYGDGDYYVIYKDSGGNIIRDYEWLEEIALPVSAEEWQTSNLTPTYISATTFSVPGDQTEVLDVGRILKIQLSSSIIYRRIEVSAYTTVTTITVATGLTSPITSFEYSFLNGTNQSVPDPIKSDLGDDNSFSVVKTATTTSATSGIIVTPAATGNNPSISVDGEDVGLDIEGVTLKNGEITLRAKPVYGMVILDTPEELINTTTVSATPAAHNSATLNAAEATAAILQIYVFPTSGTTSVAAFGVDNTISIADAKDIKVAASDAGAGDLATARSEVTVNLDANHDFWYAVSGNPVQGFTVHLVGYYV